MLIKIMLLWNLSPICLVLACLIFEINTKIINKSIKKQDLLRQKNSFYQLSKFSIGSQGGNISILVKLSQRHQSTEKFILMDLVESNNLEAYKDPQNKLPQHSIVSQRFIIKFAQAGQKQIQFLAINPQNKITNKQRQFHEYYLMLNINLPQKLDLLNWYINNYQFIQFQITWFNGQSHVGQGQYIIHVYFIIMVSALFVFQNQGKLVYWRYKLAKSFIIVFVGTIVVQQVARITNALIYIQLGLYNQQINIIIKCIANFCDIVQQIVFMFTLWWMSQQSDISVRRQAIKKNEYIPAYQQEQSQYSFFQLGCRTLCVITTLILALTKFVFKMMQQEQNKNFSSQRYTFAIELIIFAFFGQLLIKRIQQNQFNDRQMLTKVLITTFVYTIAEWLIPIMIRIFANEVSYFQYDILIIQITQLILIRYIWKLLIRHAEQYQIFNNNASNDQNKSKTRNYSHND